MSRYEYVDCKPYKGYDISKSYELDSRGRRIPNSGRYMVSDSEEDWIGDVYKTLSEAHRFIDEYEADMTGVVGSEDITASTGRTTSVDYIKTALFDWLTDYFGLDVDGVPADQVVRRVQAIAPTFDINDVFNRSMDENIAFVDALAELEDELSGM